MSSRSSSSNRYKLKEFLEIAVCPVFMPKTDERNLSMACSDYIKCSPKKVYECTYHFKDEKPSELHCNPEMYAEYEHPPVINVVNLGLLQVIVINPAWATFVICFYYL